MQSSTLQRLLVGHVCLVGCLLCSTTASTQAPQAACSGSNDPVNLSENFDILEGQRTLLKIDDLLITAPRITGQVGGTGFTTFQPGVIVVPTEDGKQDGLDSLIASQGTTLLPTVTVGCCQGGNSPPVQSVAARPFDTAFDHVVQFVPNLAPCTPINDNLMQSRGVQIQIFEYDKGATTPIKMVSEISDNLPCNSFDCIAMSPFKMDVLVADFDQDGYDDFLFTFGTDLTFEGPVLLSNTEYFFYTAVDTSDPTKGLTNASSQTLGGGTYTTAVHGLGDLNGDGILDVAKPFGDCVEGGATCALKFFSVCPGPVANTLCAGASAFQIVEQGPEITLSTTNCNQPASDPTCILTLEVGDFDPTSAGNELFVAALDSSGGGELTTEFYSFDTAFSPTELSVDAPTLPVGGLVFTAKSTSGPIDWFGEGEQIVLSWLGFSSEAQGTLQHRLLYFDPASQRIDVAEASLPPNNNAGAVLGLALGRFDPSVGAGGAGGMGGTGDRSDFNLQLGLLYDQWLFGDKGVFTQFWDILVGESCTDGKPFCFGSATAAQNIQSVFGPVEMGFGDNDLADRYGQQNASLLAVGDLQGRGLRLGQPTVVRIQKITPSAVIASPPMHIDRLRIEDFDDTLFPIDGLNKGDACDETTATAITPETTCTINFSTVNEADSYDTNYFNTAMSSLSQSNTHKSSWTLGVQESTSVTSKVGAVGEFVSGTQTLSAGFTHDHATTNVNSSYCSQTQSLTLSAKTADAINFKSFTQNTYYYPVLGQDCDGSGQMSGSSLCTATGEAGGPLYYPITAPGQITYNFGEGSTLEWYQPPWVAGQLLSYPSACVQLAAGVNGPSVGQGFSDSFAGPIVEINNNTAASTSVTWTSGQTADTSTDTANNWSVGASWSGTVGEGVFSADTGGEQTKVTQKISTNYSGSSDTMTTSTSSISASEGVTVNLDADFLTNGPKFVYTVSPNIFGQQAKNIKNQSAKVFDSPFTNLSGDTQFSGVAVTGMLVDFPSGTWWTDVAAQGYAQYIDVGVAQPTRYAYASGGTATDPATIQCIAGGASNKYTCGTVEAHGTVADVWTSPYYAMRSFFIAPADPQNPNQGPEPGLNNAVPTGPIVDTVTEGDKVWLQTRVYNFSFMDMAQDIGVQIYAQEWDGACNLPALANGAQYTNCTNPMNLPTAPSSLIDTVSVAPLKGFPVGQQDPTSCDPENEANYNWTYATLAEPWDTTGFGGTEGLDYVFWVAVCAGDSAGNTLAELPGHGLTAGSDCSTQYDWITDVPIEAYSNNVGLYKKALHILAAESSPEPGPITPLGNVTIEGVQVTGIPRAIVGIDGQVPEMESLQIAVDLRADEHPVNGAIVNFTEGDPTSGAVFDQEIIARIKPGALHRARVNYRPQDCGPKSLTVQVLDRGSNPSRSVAVDVPCDEVIRPGSRVKATPLHSRKAESNEKLVLEFDDVEVDLGRAELRLEDILVSEWGEEQIQSRKETPLVPLTLTRAHKQPPKSWGWWGWFWHWWHHGWYDFHRREVELRGHHDGSRVKATLRKHGNKLRIELDLKRVNVHRSLFCAADHTQQLRTSMLLSDDAHDPQLLIAQGGWQCKGKGSVIVPRR